MYSTDSDKTSSLLSFVINYDRKKFYSLWYKQLDF